jgi:hypothetical protein
MKVRLTRAACVALGASGLLTLTVIPAAQTATASASGATVSVFHGIPGATVDIYANGNRLLSGVTPGTLSRPLSLTAGSYDIKIVRAGAPSTSTPVVEKKVNLANGSNDSLTANLTASGQPALNAFVNDVSSLPTGQSRLIVRHVAAAPAVDVRADGKKLFTGLKNPGQAQAEVAAGTVNADIVLAGTNTVVLGPTQLNLTRATGTVVYAWGSAANDTLALKVQKLPAR